MTEGELIGLLRTLVETPSVSHEETALADRVQAWLEGHGLPVRRIGDTVVSTAGEGPPVLFNSHLDTVPATAAWTRDPWRLTVEGDKLYGLGSNDAKASGAAMLATLLDVHRKGGPCELTVMLAPEEETGGKGTEVAWPTLRGEGYGPAGVVVGEPTGLNVGVAQKGLMVLELVAEGQACHAANAHRLGAVNPVWQLARDLVALEGLCFGTDHPELGPVTLQPTRLEAAGASNQVAARAVATLDVRTIPGLSHAETVAAIRRRVSGAVVERSTRLEPYSCPEGARIVRAALAAREETRPFASPTMSDQVWFRGVEAVKCGPGESARSHTPDEFVLGSELWEGYGFYGRLLERFAEAGRG